MKRLSENARIASITASNAIEGVVVDGERAERIVEGAPRFRNRSEQGFAGYRDAVDGLMRGEEFESLSVPFVLHLHRQMFAHSGGRGGSLKTDENLIVSYERGDREIVFVPPAPDDTEFLLTECLARYSRLKHEAQAHPLYQSQRDWHQGHHTIWPWTTYLAQVVADAYEDLEKRVTAASEPKGSKQDRVRRHILEEAPVVFRRREIERALPEVSPATIRIVINALRDDGDIVAEGGRTDCSMAPRGSDDGTMMTPAGHHRSRRRSLPAASAMRDADAVVVIESMS